MNLNTRKSQGMPINVIIIAALALVVLFVLIIIFTTQTGKTVSTLQSCGGVAGRCAEAGKACDDTEIEKSDAQCQPSTRKCCIKVFETKK